MEQDPYSYHSRLTEIIKSDTWRMHVLSLVSDISKGQAWIGGGFVRHLVWDTIGESNQHQLSDIDVIYLGDGTGNFEGIWESKLSSILKSVKWSVKDQNRMAKIHGHHRYHSIEEALSYWVEKCTAVAVRKNSKIEILAPYGLEELFQGIVSPSNESMITTMEERIEDKRWLQEYPFLEVRTT